MNATRALRPGTLVTGAILGVAALLRFGYLDAIEHNVDHAYPIHQALRTLEQGYLPLTGQETSVLFANPPLTGYLYVPVLAVWRSPVAAYLLVIALNTVAVWLCYRTALKLFGQPPAWIAAALMAINPWVVEYSRATWVQGLVPFLACLTAYWLFPALAGQSRRPARDVFAALVALTALTQTYLPAFVAAVPVAVLLVIFRRRVPWRAALAGGLVFALALSLYAAGLLAGWERTRAKLDVFVSTGSAPALNSEAWWHAFRLVTGEDYAIARGTWAPPRDAETRQALLQVAHWALLAALGAGAALAGARAWRRRPGGEAGLIALVWFALPPLLMTVTTQPVHPFYLLVTLPAGHLLAGMGIGSALAPLLAGAKPHARLGWAALAMAGAALAALFGTNSARYYQETRVIPGAHALSALPLSEGLRLGATINRLLGDGPRFVSIDLNAEAVSSLCGRVTDVSRDQRFPALTRVLPWPGGVTVVFLGGGKPGGLSPVGAELVEDATRVLVDGTSILYYRHPRAGDDPAWLPAGGARVEWPTDRGLTLAWWAWQGEALVTGWRVDSLPDDYARWLLGPFVHVFDRDGRRLSVLSGEAVPGYDWRVGQLYIQRIAVPGGRAAGAHFEIGLYDAIRAQNAVFQPPGGDSSTIYRIDP